jgi:two-component system catabolic regulation response regulator CreB/two-component system response regulator ChvI
VISRKPISDHKRQKKVLFVDNEPDITTMLKMALERAGFSIDVFNDPLLALENFKPKMYDLVILDVMMPKMDGLELYNQLKSVDPSIKGCFLTASSETYSEELRKKKGRHCELNKDLFLYMPLPISKIVEEINRRIQ